MLEKEIKAACLRLLARREYSQLELITRLALKGFVKTQVQTIVENLANQGLQSDLRFAQSYARTRFNKGFGCLKVQYELQQRGIKEFDLHAVIVENFGDELTLINQVYHKKYANNHEITTQEALKRQRFLQQRGFSVALIQSLFKSLKISKGNTNVLARSV